VSGAPIHARGRARAALVGAALLLGAGAGDAAPPAAKARRPDPGRPDLSAPLAGTTYDYAWDGAASGHPERSWLGRAYVPPEVARAASRPTPVLVFLHGLNRELIAYRWMGGGREGDVRRIVQDLIDRKLIEPTLVVAPSSIMRAAVTNAETSWPAFDLDTFLAETRAALKGRATIDETRVIVAGHSGAGCNDKGGLATIAASAKPSLVALLSIDTCMGLGLAQKLKQVDAATAVVVTYQAQTWTKRPFTDFKRAFRVVRPGSVDAGPAPVREVELIQPREAFPHDALVHLSLERWLPRWLGPTTPTLP
jgi:hypothetical protein